TSGGANDATFDGNLTIVNQASFDITGPLILTFRDLPPDVQLMNATGTDAKTGAPVITVPINTLSIGEVLRVPVKFRNPLGRPLGTFVEGPYFVDVTSSPPF